MLTVKHLTASGAEHLYISPTVSYQPGVYPIQPTPADPYVDPTVWVDSSDGGRLPLLSGTVFVMNDRGSTVARYYLGNPDPSVPQPALPPATLPVAA